MKKKLVFAFAITLLVNPLPTTTVQPMSSPAASPAASPTPSDNEGSGVTPNRSSSSDCESESDSDADSENIDADVVDDIVGCNAAAVADHIDGGLTVEKLFEVILGNLEASNEEYKGNKEKLEKEQAVYSRLLLQLMTDHNVDLSKPATEFAEKADAGGFPIIAQLLDLIAQAESFNTIINTIESLQADLAATRKLLSQLQKPHTKSSSPAAQPNFLRRMVNWCFRVKAS